MRYADTSNSADVIDSRDIITRIEELEGILDDLQTAVDEQDDTSCESTGDMAEANEALAEFKDSDEYTELEILRKLAEDASGSPDWAYGETLIRDSYFQDYAEQLAEDVCEMSKATEWPFRHIDWEAAANELKSDYMSVDFDGVDYWIRA